MSGYARSERLPTLIGLLLAALVGIGLGWQSANRGEPVQDGQNTATTDEQTVTNSAVAKVGQVGILTVEVEAKLREMGVDPASASPEQASEALEVLIEEELWLQAALAGDVLRDHRGLRDAVVRRMLDVIFPAADELDEASLKRLYEEKYPRDQETAPPFEKVRFRLEKEQQRIRNSRALEQYLLWLRQSTEVEMLAQESDLRDLLVTVYGDNAPVLTDGVEADGPIEGSKP